MILRIGRRSSLVALEAALVVGCVGCGQHGGGSSTASGSQGTKAASAATAPTTASTTSGAVAALPAATGPDTLAFFSNFGPIEPVFGQLSVNPATGQLAYVGSSSLILDGSPNDIGPNALTMDPGGHFLVMLVGNSPGTAALVSYSLDPVPGFMVEVGCEALPASATLPQYLFFTAPDAIVAGASDGSIYSFAFVPSTGSVVLTSSIATPIPAGALFNQLSLAVAGSFVYETWIDLNQGTPTAGGGTFSGPSSPSNIFVASLGSGGVLTAGATIACPSWTVAITHPSQRFFYLADVNGMTACTPDPATGAPVRGATLSSLADRTITFTPSGAFGYSLLRSTSSAPDTLSSFSVDPTTGALAALATQALAGPTTSVSVDRLGRFLYVSTDATTGASAAPVAMPQTTEIQAYAIDFMGGITPSGAPLMLTLPSVVSVAATAP
jgi:hypothetical protein